MHKLKNAATLSIIALGALILSAILALTANAVPADYAKSPFESPFHSPVPKPVTESVKVPLDMRVWNPCAEEWIQLSGRLHTVFHVSYDALGGYHAQAHFQPQGVRGYGEESGIKYQGNGVTLESFNSKVGMQETFVNSFRLIGRGKGNNLLIQQTFHVAVNANGKVTALVDNSSIECR